MNEYDYKNLTPFKWFILENFPFIEASFDALTNWQLFCKLGEEMNKIIDKVNESGEEVENLSNAFISLQNYINNYFSNLDIQEEIDNKLDEMAIQGTLQEIILEYLNTKGCLYFNTVNEMINYQHFNEGAFVKTGGYYEINDGKDATYKIISNTTGYDETNIIELNNNLYALDITNIKYNRPFRILLISDIHYTAFNFYSIPAQNRLEMLLNDILAENNKRKIDGILILGDLSTDNYGWEEASSTVDGSNYVKRLFKEWAFKLNCPIYTLPGNHDSWNNDVWKSITGYNREYSIEFDDKAFIMLDTFNNPALTGAGGTYKGVNTTFLSNELKKFKDKKIFLCAHFFDKDNESETFKNIVKNNDNIIALFCGHTHTYRSYNLGAEYGNKMLYMTGNYSVSLNRSATIYNPDTTWGFRNLELTSSGIETSVIRPTHTFKFDGNTYTHNYSIEDIEIIDRNIVYKNTADFHFKKDDNNNTTFNILSELPKNVYTLKDCQLISENTDINDITEIGVYISPSVAVSTTLTCGGGSLPTGTAAFKLVNEKLNGNLSDNINYYAMRQTLQPLFTNNYIFFRFRGADNIWSAWKKVLCTNDLDLQQQRITFGAHNKSSLWFYKSGRVVTLRVQISFEDLQTNLSNTWNTINFGEIIPEAYKPAHQIAFNYYSNFNNSQSINCLFTELGADSKIFKIQTATVPLDTLPNSQGSYIFGNITYITH